MTALRHCTRSRWTTSLVLALYVAAHGTAWLFHDHFHPSTVAQDGASCNRTEWAGGEQLAHHEHNHGRPADSPYAPQASHHAATESDGSSCPTCPAESCEICRFLAQPTLAPAVVDAPPLVAPAVYVCDPAPLCIPHGRVLRLAARAPPARVA